MAFQEPTDPLVEKLQVLIDNLEQDILCNEFKDTLQQLNEEFPFVDVLEFLEMYVDGDLDNHLIEKFHFFGFVHYCKLLQILKLNRKRKSVDKNFKSRKKNFEDKKLVKRYEFLRPILLKHEQLIKDKINHNVLRAVIILQLFSNGPDFTNKKNITLSISQSIQDLECLVLAPHMPLLEINNNKIKEMINSIMSDLEDDLFLDADNQNNIRLQKQQMRLGKYIFNMIENRVDGITHQELIMTLKDRLPIIAQIPDILIAMTMQDLIATNQVIRKEGYLESKPFFDQYFTLENYKKMNEDNVSFQKKFKFFGRKITPDNFIQEIIKLEKGDFEDQDDQVTRIAGMVLANSNMLSHPPNRLKDFDFAVDLSRYEFTVEQQKIIRNMNLEIKSDIIYVKVMIDEKISLNKISNLILKLNSRENNEQGFIITFIELDEKIKKILEKDKTIQIISKKELKEWCKITPIIPSRRGAVAVVRKGDHRESIVKIKSINYESGRADIVLFPKLEIKTQYIGALEEIPLPVSLENFVMYSNIYFQFLGKLRQVSKTDIFRKIITCESIFPSRLKKIPLIRIVSDQYIECIFDEQFKTKINLQKQLDKSSLKYSIDDLFSCTCFQWNQKNRTDGLCDHLIFTLNVSIKKILSSGNNSSESDIEHLLQKIEQKMDLFLYRLKYSNTDNSMVAKCPNCGDVATTLKQVEEKFGFRQMDKDDKFSLRRQSQCKKCR